jgi:hypothetical protein
LIRGPRKYQKVLTGELRGEGRRKLSLRTFIISIKKLRAESAWRYKNQHAAFIARRCLISNLCQTNLQEVEVNENFSARPLKNVIAPGAKVSLSKMPLTLN